MTDAEISKPTRVGLSREFSDFLIELSIALHKHAMYPSGHPSLEPAAAAVVRRAERLLEDRPSIALGVARRQLIIEGVATDPDQPVLRRLAEGLHRHHLGAISITRGVEASEIGSALRALSCEVELDGPLGLAPADRTLSLTHVRLHPLTFDRLELVGEAPLVTGGAGGQGGARSAELWIGLARAAMANEGAGQPAEAAPAEPSVVARAIDDHHGVAAYDQVVVGYLLQIAGELKTASGAEAAALRRRTSRLISALKPETLQRLIQMGGDAAQRNAFVLDATSGMAVDAVIEILKAAADAGGQTISHGLVRMLSKLATNAELGNEQVRPLADTALREQVTSLLSGWQLADPNPDAYNKVLQHLATTAPREERSAGERDFADQPDPLRLVQMSLEAGAVGPGLDRAIDRAVDLGAAGSLLKLLESAPAASEVAKDSVLSRLLLPSTISRLLARDPIDFETLDCVFPRLTIDGYEMLLNALVACTHRATRRKLLDRLPRTDLDIAPLIVTRLADERWFVQRNMLLLLGRLGRIPTGLSLTPWTRHEDARVRYEAVNVQITVPAERTIAITSALGDSDSRIVRLGLTALQDQWPSEMTGLVVRVALNPVAIEDLRVLAVGALARSGDRSALDALLHLVDGGRTLLGRPRLAPRTPLSLAALRALARSRTSDPHAATMLALARGSSDPDVRQAAQQVQP